MAREGTKVGVVAGFFGGGEVKEVFGFRVDDGDVMENFGEIRDVTFITGFGVIKHGEGGLSNFLGGAGGDDDEVVRHDVGVFERQ